MSSFFAQVLLEVRNTLEISGENVAWFASYSIISLKISSELSASKLPQLAKKVNFQINITFKVVKILSLNFKDFFKSLHSVRANFEEI